MDFGKIIKEKREIKGISRMKLAELSGFTDRAIAYWEYGERQISLENADRLLKALGTTLSIGKEEKK